jgi:catechol 2,3-dioxygenase-like lactoylglutathione lyase family enzyme
MFKHITHTTLYVLDQDEALDFYVGKLGLVVQADADMDVMRYLTVTLPDDDSLQLMLLLPGPPLHDEATAEQVRELTERFYGTDCALRDPFGNPLRFSERPAT